MGKFVSRDPLGELLDGRGLEGYGGSADDIACGSHSIDVGARKASPVDRNQIIFGLQILQVQAKFKISA